jgi:hypothetical protein
VFDGTTDDSAALQDCLNSNSQVDISDGTLDMEAGTFVTVPANTTISGDGTVIGGFTVNGDGVTIKGITVQQATGLDSGNLIAGIQSTEHNDLTIEDVTFNTCALEINTNDITTVQSGFRIVRNVWTGDVSADAAAISCSLGNVHDLEMVGNRFEQTNLLGILKTSSSGYGIAPDEVDDNYNQRMVIAFNFFGGSINALATTPELIDLYSSATELVFSKNVINCSDTAAGAVILTKSGGGTGPNTIQHRNIIISQNIITTDCQTTVFNLQGAFGQSFESTAQNIHVIGNIINATNNSAARGINVNAYNRALVAGNEINYTGTASTFYGISVRACQYADVDGGQITGASILVSESGGDPVMLVANVDNVTVMNPPGERGIEFNGIDGGAGTILAARHNTIYGAAAAPIEFDNVTVEQATVVGNTSDTQSVVTS